MTRVPGTTWSALGLCVGGVLALAVTGSPEGEVKMTNFSPTQLARGHVTEVGALIDEKAVLQSAEATPADGVSVGEIKVLDDKRSDGMKRWSLVFTVDKQAEPGKRSVVLVTSGGRTAPQEVEIPPHVPEIGRFSVTKVQRKPLLVELSVSVSDAGNDLGDSPGLFYVLRCGGSFMGSIAKAKAVRVGPGRSQVTVSIDQPDQAVLEPVVCDLEVTLSDEKGYDGRLQTTVDFK
jgi:hypothetical protein